MSLISKHALFYDFTQYARVIIDDPNEIAWEHIKNGIKILPISCLMAKQSAEKVKVVCEVLIKAFQENPRLAFKIKTDSKKRQYWVVPYELEAINAYFLPSICKEAFLLDKSFTKDEKTVEATLRLLLDLQDLATKLLCFLNELDKESKILLLGDAGFKLMLVAFKESIDAIKKSKHRALLTTGSALIVMIGVAVIIAAIGTALFFSPFAFPATIVGIGGLNITLLLLVAIQRIQAFLKDKAQAKMKALYSKSSLESKAYEKIQALVRLHCDSLDDLYKKVVKPLSSDSFFVNIKNFFSKICLINRIANSHL